jgi:RNA polymerase sigma-B factor
MTSLQTTPGEAVQADRLQADRALFVRYRDHRDPALRAALVERFMPLARQLASRYARAEEPFEDLLQVACLGLLKAIDRYEVDRGVAFSSYAVPTILGELKRHFRDRTWSMRVPRELQELSLRSERVIGELTSRIGRAPTVTELAGALQVTEEEVLEAMEVGRVQRATSLEQPRDDSGESDTLADCLGADDEGFTRAEERATLARLLRTLTPREREVVRLRFEHDLMQREIGDRIGVSQMQVSGILRVAISRLRIVAAGGDGQAVDAGSSGPAHG